MGFWNQRVSLISSFWNFTWSFPKISSWLLSNHQFGNRQVCNRWPGRWWGCTLLMILQVVLAPQRAVWGWSLAFQKLTTQRPLRMESRQSESQRKSTWPPGERSNRQQNQDTCWEYWCGGKAGSLCILNKVYHLSISPVCRNHFIWTSEILGQEKLLQFFIPLTTFHLFFTPEFECAQRPKV